MEAVNARNAVRHSFGARSKYPVRVTDQRNVVNNMLIQKSNSYHTVHHFDLYAVPVDVAHSDSAQPARPPELFVKRSVALLSNI